MTYDPFGVAIAPVPFYGVYLPFICAAESCSRQPLCLVFDSAHFMPLVASADAAAPAVRLPLVDKEYEPLPLRFGMGDDELGSAEARERLLVRADCQSCLLVGWLVWFPGRRAPFSWPRYHIASATTQLRPEAPP